MKAKVKRSNKTDEKTKEFEDRNVNKGKKWILVKFQGQEF